MKWSPERQQLRLDYLWCVLPLYKHDEEYDSEILSYIKAIQPEEAAALEPAPPPVSKAKSLCAKPYTGSPASILRP